MHSSLTRLQSVFSLATTIAFTLAAAIALTPLLRLSSPTPTASLTLRSAQVVRGRPHYYSTKKEEYAHVRFDLDADLSGLFTWNTKQLFVWISAVYPASQTAEKAPLGGQDVPLSNAVIWDVIVPAPATPFAYANVKRLYLDPIASYATELYNSYFSKKKSASHSRTRAKPKPKPSSSPKRPSASSSSPSTKEVAKPGTFHLTNQKPKYQITDITGVLAERANATLQLGWNVQPWVGALVWDTGYLGERIGSWEVGKGGVSATWQFPALKGSKKEGVKAEAAGGTETARREEKVREEGRAEPVGPTG